MDDQAARTFGADFKRFFLRGLVVLLPSVLTLWIVVKAYQFVDNAIAEPINRGIRLGMIELAPHWQPLRTWFDPDDDEVAFALEAAGARPPLSRSELETTRAATRLRMRAENIQSWWHERWYLDLIGLVVAIVAVYVAGRLLGGFLGRRFYRRIERLITTLPVFKQVYPYVKQIVDFLFSDDRQLKFNRVVLLEYPRKGIWSMGFLTSPQMTLARAHVSDAVVVFIPSSPTPFTGYTITLPRSEVIEMPISVEEAIRFVVSGGVLLPGAERAAPAEVEAQAAMLAAAAGLETASVEHEALAPGRGPAHAVAAGSPPSQARLDR